VGAFLLGVASSLVATGIAVLLARYLPARIRSILTAMVARALDCGIDHVFASEDVASSDMLASSARSRKIRVLSIRGFRLTDEARPLNGLLDRRQAYDTLEVMLADPDSEAALRRSVDFSEMSPTHFLAQQYRSDIVRSLTTLAEAAKINKRILVRTHTQCESFRLFINDEYVYLSFFPKGRSGSTSPVYRIRRATLLYEAMEAHYEWVRETASQAHNASRPPRGPEVTYSTVVSSETAALHLYDPDWVFVDCRFDLADAEAGRRAYKQAHIPGASYVHLDKDLSGLVVPGRTGRHPLPSKRGVEELISRLGIHPTTQVVAYDDAGGAMAAARLWWILQWAGHESSAVLDGGISAWKVRNLPVTDRLPNRTPSNFAAHWRDRLVVDAETVAAVGTGIRLVDARAADRYRGENETIDPVAGHIPGAVSLPYESLLSEDRHLLPTQQVAARISAVMQGRTIEDAIFYCGSGVTSAHTVLAVAYSTGQMPKLYAGSWSDWITDAERPVELGEHGRP
jgi:thiosulfate/3-mercaptopyruvate sulfurtransferase